MKGGARRLEGESGLSIAEVLIAAMVTGIGLAGVFTLNFQSLSALKQTRNAATGSQLLQQRTEALRLSPFASVAAAVPLRGLMQNATQAEREICGVTNLTETVRVSTFSAAPETTPQSFSVVRSNGVASTASSANFSDSAMVKVSLLLTWQDRAGTHQRALSTVVSDNGLNTRGISSKPSMGNGAPSSQTTPGTPAPSPTPSGDSTPAPASTPWPPAICRHGRTWPHCYQP